MHVFLLIISRWETTPYSISRRAVTNGSALSSFTTTSTPLPRDAFGHKLLADNVPIAFDISTYGSSDSRPNLTFHHLDAGSSRVESSWNFYESRGDGKIRGGGKYSNHHHHHHHYHRHRRPLHPWPTSHSENAREAPLPGAPFIAGLAEGRGRAWEEDGGQRRRWLGGRKSDCQYIP